MPSLSASRLNDYLGCPHQAALWLAGIKPAEDADATLQLIRDKGFEHEAAVLARLEERFGPAEHIPSDASLADRTRLTREAITRGAKLIYQGALIKDAWLGYPDFLVRNGDDGATTFEPEDAKLARSAKGEYVLQLGIYAELLEELFGIPVQGGVIHVAAGEPVPFDLRRTRFILRRLMRSFERFVAKEKRATKPRPCAACPQCDYKARCESEWREADSPFFVAGVSGAQVTKLAAAGVTTLAQLAALPANAKVDGMGTETLEKLSAQARLQGAARASGQHGFELLPYARGRGFAMLPVPDGGDLYFDMEGDPLAGEGLEYLFGIYGRLNGSHEPAFQPIWAHNPADEKVAFEKLMRLLIEQVRRHPNAHIYHYAAYETTALKRLAMRYATMEAELDQLLRERRFVDLYRAVVQAMRASTESYSIKDLEALYWRARSGEVRTASDSIVEYERWCLTKDNAILDSIAAYNKDDCVSTAQLHAWLEKLRPPGINLEIVDDTAGEKREQSAERAQLEVRKQALAVAVRTCPHGDARMRDLIAELLWFHQRSQKPGWWALFERQAWSEDELVDDAESLGGLQRDTSKAPVPVKRSFDTAFVFPPQDTKLKVGDMPRIAETIGSAGTIIEISAEDGRVVLRRGAKAPVMPDRFSLVPAPINLQGVPEAVLDFANRFVSGASQEDQALLDILMRSTPRLKGRTTGLPIRQPDEPLTDAVIRAVADLDHSYLFIQGPPGTGKTYTAALAIVTLLKAGKRVGVSSNSHKAINKLLAEVDARAAEAQFRFKGAKKGNDGKPETEYDSTNIVTVVKSEDVMPQHSLVGGTVFHFCRDDQRNEYDYLFIDEAGQVSLGNLVAMGAAAANIVLVGDQMQLPQPVQGVHPGETGLSSLEYLLEDRATVPEDRGILLNESRRLHPALCRFISNAIYDGRLGSHPSTEARYLRLRPDAPGALRPAGLSFVPVGHDGCTQSSRAEAEAIAELVQALLAQEVIRDGSASPLTLDDILVVAPYNLQVNLLKQLLPSGSHVGTVDKFQGQEAAVVIVSMTTSKGVEAPRGTEFLFNPNRFNVAVSRAQCLALVVHGAQLLEGAWTKIDDLRRLNLFAHAESIALNRP
ncbi:TM0106 family RecB-like putative nuclease [Bradyrhizobium quebecense]|uniref:TM0106 family RecB-like putative nuclease n=1 Tax=Bradyrhizobium quebecense TaxID=2748629 RepID=A0A973WXQ5_9BRAD|nr:TM0106 family RecB-like putative nuclease [Bradyrhizobium quebecense]UGA43034.1 TM0106 family RecB-like putative nuclease [Bradyrhizobium quebecense]